MNQEDFVGREWLFGAIDSWLAKDLEPNESGVFVIWGAAGTGKTSFARELVRRYQQGKVAASHFFEKDNPLTYHVQTIVLDLQKMLSTNLPDYAASVTRGELLVELAKLRQPEELFDTFITKPLQQLPENSKTFLVVDALDESDSTASSCFIKLSAKLPLWLRIIFTARHDASGLSNLSVPDSNFASLDHFKSSPQSLLSLNKDIRKFVSMKNKKLQSDYPSIPPFFADNEQAAEEKVIEASQNCFLYAKLVMEHTFAGHDEIGLPGSLFDLYCLDFKRRFADVNFFQEKIAPVIEVVLAIVSASVKLYEDELKDNALFSIISSSHDFSCFTEDEERLARVVDEGHVSPGFSRRDLDKAFELLSGYLMKTASGLYQFTHSSVSDWFHAQEKGSDFFCDVTKGHSTMATSMLKTLKKELPPDDEVAFRNSVDVYGRLLIKKSFFIRHLFHSSFLPERGGASDVNKMLSELGIKEMNLLVAVSGMSMGGPRPAPIYTPSDYLTMKILDETDVLLSMHSLQIETYLKKAIEANCASVIEKFFNFSNWLFSPKILSAISDAGTFKKLVESILKKGLAPQLLFSLLCCKEIVMAFFDLVRFCSENGVTADICVPTICENTKKLQQSVCWNEDVQEYFRRLKAGERNVITLESLKNMPLRPSEANVDRFTLKKIHEPLSKVERLVKDGRCFIQFKYAWHAYFKNNHKSLGVVGYILKHGANVNNRGSSGVTALMYACQQQDERLVSFFLEAGAAVNQQNFFGSTALHYAVKIGEDSSKVSQEIIEKLLQHKADPYLKNFLGVSAVDLAKKKKKQVLGKLMIDQPTNQK